jgi:serine/threonine protein kinase
MTTSSDVAVEVDEAPTVSNGTQRSQPVAPLWLDPDTLVGSVFSERYKLVRVIGQGGMGAVFLAEHIVIGKSIAVKVLSPEYSQNPGDVQRFLQEARAASLVRHDHIVDISDFGYTPQGQAYLVMEYLEGEDLAHTIIRSGRMPWFRTTNIIVQIASALAAAHAKGVIHRDMKPENCFLVRREDNEDFIKVLDFGIAKIIDERLVSRGTSLTAEGGIIGTPEYIAPELVRGLKPDARVDIYALGVIMYRLLTGTLPFTTDTGNYMAILSQHLMEPPQPPRQRAPEAQVPREIEAIVLRALAKEPGARYQTVEEMIAAIREAQLLLTGASSTGLMTNLPVIVPRTLRASSSRRRKRRALWLAIGLTGGVALGGLGVWLVTRGAPAPHDMPERTADVPAPVIERVVAPPPLPTPPPDPTRVAAAESTGAPAGGPDGGARPTVLSDADFKREIAEIQRAIRSRCSGLPGMKIGAKIYIEADGSVSRVVPQGALAGSSFGTCVVKQIRAARFRRALRASVRSATFTL